MFNAILIWGIFAVLFLVLRPFGTRTELVCLVSIASSWVLAALENPAAAGACFCALLAGVYLGFRIMPAQALAGLGLPPWLAREHVQFDAIASCVPNRGRQSGSPLYDLEFERRMHEGTLRMYKYCVFWALASTSGHLFFLQFAPIPISLPQVFLTGFPVGFVLKRWLARRGSK